MAKRVKVCTLEGFVKFAVPDTQVDFIDFFGSSWRKFTSTTIPHCKSDPSVVNDFWKPALCAETAMDTINITIYNNTVTLVTATRSTNIIIDSTIINHESFVKMKLNLQKITKRKLLVALLKQYKLSGFKGHDLLRIMESAKIAGHGYPELDMIEKSILSESNPRELKIEEEILGMEIE